jgi:ankyrin repeat protein
VCTQDGRTPLHWAASSGSTEIACYLIAKNCDVDKVDESGWTALHIAGRILEYGKHNAVLKSCSIVSAGNEDIVRELVGAGADINRKNDKGITPLSVMFPLRITF